MKFQLKLKLPTTPKEFDLLVKRVVKKYSLTDEHHAAAIISVAIRRLPNDSAYTTYSYLGESVLKNLANFVADHKSQMLQHEGQIRQLSDILKQNPLDQEAYDNLKKAADEGSMPAKLALDEFLKQHEPKTQLSVVHEPEVHTEGVF